MLNETNPAAGDRFKFTGRELSAALGLYYYRARWYDPQAGRFLAEDPLSFAAGDINLYRYVFNVPVLGKDPTGEVVWFIVVGVVVIGGVLLTPTQLGPTPTPHSDPALEPVGLDDFPTLNNQRIIFGRGSFSIEHRKIIVGEIRRILLIARNQPAGLSCTDWVARVLDAYGGVDAEVRKLLHVEHIAWEYWLIPPFPSGPWRLGHMGIRIRIIGGGTFYLDNGWWGGHDNVFFSQEIPWWVYQYDPLD